MEQVRDDNNRLMKLLKQTKEYQEFANFVEDSGGNVRNVEKALIEQHENLDDDNWLPSDAYALAHKFRENHGGELTAQLVN